MNKVYASAYQIIPGTEECQITRITQMFSEHPKDTHFVFEPGVYHLYLTNALQRPFEVSNSWQTDLLNIGMLMENMNDIILDGQGSAFVFHGEMTPLTVTDCQNITLKNMIFDSALPCSAEATVLKTEPGAIEVSVDHTIFPYRIENGTLFFERGIGPATPMFTALEFDTATGNVQPGTGDYFPKVAVSVVDGDILRMEGNFKKLPKIGNTLVIRHGRRVHPGILIQHSKNLGLEGLTLHQTCGLGVLFQFNENISVSKVSFRANDKKGIKVTSGHDDGLHFANTKGAITVEDCDFNGLMDDPINVHGIATGIVEKTAPNVLRCAYCHDMAYNFKKWALPGDEVSFVNHVNRLSYGTGIVTKYELLSPKEFEIHFEAPVPAEIVSGDALENITYTPSLVCRNSYFGGVRARGLLVTTPKSVLIEGNTFESSGSAITITGDVNYWYESGTCSDVTIRNNRFVKCCTSPYQFSDAVIHVEPGVDPNQDAPVHHNIRITDNYFELAETGVLFADHTGYVLLKNNEVITDKKEMTEVIELHSSNDIHMEENILKIIGD